MVSLRMADAAAVTVWAQGGEEEGAQLVDQAFLPRIVEGEVRVLFVGSRPVEIVHKKPRPGSLSATLKSGACYTRYTPDDSKYRSFIKTFVDRFEPCAPPKAKPETRNHALQWIS